MARRMPRKVAQEITNGKPDGRARSPSAQWMARRAVPCLQLPNYSTIYYERGDPAEGILRALKENKIDMVIAGALEKEVVLHPFLGNVARRLVREADCSIMLF